MWTWNKRIVITDYAQKQLYKRRHIVANDRRISLYKMAHASVRACSLAHIDNDDLEFFKNKAVGSDQLFSYYNGLIVVFSKNKDCSLALVIIMPFGTVRNIPQVSLVY